MTKSYRVKYLPHGATGYVVSTFKTREAAIDWMMAIEGSADYCYTGTQRLVLDVIIEEWDAFHECR